MLKKLFLSILVLSILFVSYLLYKSYQRLFQPNVIIKEAKTAYMYIPTGATLEDVVSLLYENNYIINRNSFEWLAEKKNYRNHIYPGRYKLTNGMSNNKLLDLLRSGKQEPVKVVFNNVRTKEQLAGKIAKQIEADSISIMRLLKDKDFIGKYDLNIATISCIFLPNTYEFWWNTSAEKFIDRMNNEYKKFWNEKRLSKAKVLNLTKEDVVTIASIVDEETYKKDEMDDIAGVYINRLRKRMPLQADPTIKFALGDFTVKRILKKHLDIDSPYNTYKFYGLPPGPISIPSIDAIDAVLNYKEHDYLYFCASADFSGYHVFAKTLSQHNVNARAYQRALNKEKIYK
ncbi:MAG: aminodeoxychorismate lyase [Bacteroidetes bacterium GWF2_33_16]|nr:MAG: aminodeoxychorismate lyase [Bacteroidetes bacterium GWE2_32_14]OFY06732.1 MAG: aminodeoxychorismate lyase [Bacteroidetes bacterium GWF2_33_16]